MKIINDKELFGHVVKDKASVLKCAVLNKNYSLGDRLKFSQI